MSPRKTLSHVQPHQVATLQALALETFTQSFAHHFPAALMRDYLQNKLSPAQVHQEFNDPNNHFFFIQHPVQNPAGYVKITPHSRRYLEFLDDATPPPEAPCLLERFYLLESAHGYGLAPQAMRELFEWVQHNTRCTNVYLSVYAQNPRAHRFYEKMGFYRIGESLYNFSPDFRPRDFLYLYTF